MSQAIFENGLGYEGKVTLTLKSNNRVLNSKTYKNNGTAQLFTFLGHCLMGAYEDVSYLLPNKILLLQNRASSPIGADATAVDQRSTWQGLAQTPTFISKSNPDQVRIIYSFEVPKAAITGPFNQIALYGAGITADDLDKFSAYHYLTELDQFDTQEAVHWSATTVLLIEWELTLSNKNIETHAN